MSNTLCPECTEAVSFAPEIPAEIRVACPWCSAEYTIGDLARQAPPPVIILDDIVLPGGPASDSEENHSDDLSLSAPEAILSPPKPRFHFDTPAEDVSAAVGPDIRKAAQNKRTPAKNTNFGSEIIKVGLGGIVGLALAQGILWWLPQHLRRDPLGLAPRLPAVLAFLAPPELRGEPASDPRGDQDAETETRPGMDLTSDRSDWQDIEPPKVDSLPGPGGASLKTREPLADLPESATPDGHDGPAGARDRPAYSTEDVVRAVQDIVQIGDPWQADSKTKLQYFMNMYRLASRYTYLEKSMDVEALAPIRLSEQIEAVLENLYSNDQRLAFVGEVAAVWLQRKNREDPGITLAGTVAAVNRQGAYWVATVRLLGDTPHELWVVSTFQPEFQQADRVLILGAIIDDARRDLLHAPEGVDKAVLLGYAKTLKT